MNNHVSYLCGAALFLGAALLNQSVQAQLNLTGDKYTQDFNAISNGIPIGWSIRTNATAATLGGVTTNYSAAKTWGDTGGEFGNCASTVANSGTNFNGSEPSTPTQAGCTNRALAVRQTGSFGDPGAAFVLQIADTIGRSNLRLTVDMDLLRTNSNSTTWTIQYGIGNSPSSFVTLGDYSDPGIFGATTRTYDLGADASGSSSNVWIRIVALSPASGSGSRDTFGIDNFSLSWITNGVPITRPSITGLILTNGNVQIDFTGDTGDSPSAFGLQCVGRCPDIFGDTGATITQTSPGHFRAVSAMNGSQQFYRIKR